MRLFRERDANPGRIAGLAVGLLFAGLLVGYEPVGGDPDRIFRPIKAELARALREGRLPYWSDRLGLGVPLVAESHVAAFYPPNWLLYRALDVSAAYRLSMWLHCVALAAATYAYARQVGIGAWGGALAAVAFPLCGFLTIHSSHEWAYHALPYLPLCLLAAERYAGSGRLAWLASLALLWGVQIAVGHFQVQMWTGALALLTGGWRVVADRRPPVRLIGLAAGLAWGAAVAAVQVVPTWELAQLVGQTRRSFPELAFYSYPPAHWPELAIPGLFRGLEGGPEAPYWFTQQTNQFEACLFVGTIPLLLAFVGLVGGGRGLAPWRLIVPASLALATMPRWWPQGYELVLRLPGPGYFRCPARYTALTSLGLVLLAGRGLDRAIAPGRFRAGLALAAGFGASAFAWALAWSALRPEFRPCLDEVGLAARLAWAGLAWAFAAWVVIRWRQGTGAAWGPFLFTAVEMGAIYYLAGTTQWGWPVRLPGSSPVLTLLSREPMVGRVGGPLDNLPVRVGLASATPYTGFPPPAPNPWLKIAHDRCVGIGVGAGLGTDPMMVRWLRRYGVTHLVRDAPLADLAGEVIFRGSDPALDLLAYRPAGLPVRRDWRVERLADVFPEARAALRAVEAPDRNTLFEVLSQDDARDEAWYMPGDLPPESRPPRARSARVVRWDGRAGAVEHDGTCDLVLLRSSYPGWLARVDDGAERPVSRADGGLVAVRLDGSGVSRVRLRFRPNRLGLSVLTTVSALAAVALAFARGRRTGQAEVDRPAHLPTP